MADVDPETQALVRKLHRELNGLTRSTRPRGDGKSNAPTGRRRYARSVETSTSGSEEEGEGGDVRPSHSSDRGAPSKRARRKDHAGESLPHGKPPKQASPSSHGAGVKAGGQGGGMGLDATPAPEPFKTPIEAAAAASAHHTREQVRSAAASADKEGSVRPRVLKCFHAGVRWGIRLPRDTLKTRADLATQLNDAFAGEILSCGRGEILNIVFLDSDGRTREFPALRTSGAHDSSTRWKAAVEGALKVYVRRG